MPNELYGYDIETYPNIFTLAAERESDGQKWFFEISTRRYDAVELVAFLNAIRNSKGRMVGFNNNGFDYPIIHLVMTVPGINYPDLYDKCQAIINSAHNDWSHVMWPSDQLIPQIDLFKIHHFDNKARSTGLKMLEFNMRSPNIKDLPYPPGTILQPHEMDVLGIYNIHDVSETMKFLRESMDMIKFREELSVKYSRNFMNHSDKKIGTDLFVDALEKASPGSCYSYESGRKEKRQTIRQSINIGEIIFPYIKFKEPEFERVRQWLSSQVITNFDEEYLNIKGIFKNLTANVHGLEYKFGSGGIHASIDSAIVCSDKDYIITDCDVGGYYPEVGTANNLYPEHLSNQFCVVNDSLKQERKQYKKGTPLNLSIKLARNGAYGDSNNRYSVLYDPQYTMSITVNGQLLLCMLAQYLIDIPGLQVIQVNTDGLTVRCPRKYIEAMNNICKWWEEYTCLELEQSNYKRMFIRDVNNYIGEYEDGKLKRKGAYAHETPLENPNTQEVLWHKNHSALVIPKAAEAALVHGKDIAQFIKSHTNIYDFMLRTKIKRSDNLELSVQINDSAVSTTNLQRITRYYITNDGGTLTKVSPPTKGYQVGQWKRANSLTDDYYQSVIDELKGFHYTGLGDVLDINGCPWDERINTKNRSKYDDRRIGISVGWKVTECNDIMDANVPINYDYYIQEANKLVEPLL